jgi:hypothetical protein
MAVRLSEELQKRLLESLAEEVASLNPFVREEEKTFVRHDKIEIDLSSQNEFVVRFYWRETLVYTMPPMPGSLPSVLTLEGIEGRMELISVRNPP